MTRRRAATLAACVALAAPAAAQFRFEPAFEDAPPPPPVVVFFDVGRTLAYRDPETRKFIWYDDALPAAQALKELGLRVGLLTNVPRGWDEAMLGRLLADPIPLEELFDPVVLAQSPPPKGYPPPKPDPMAFQTALARLGFDVAPSRAIFVGENPEEIRGATLAGMRTVLLMRRGRPRRGDPGVVRSLDELVARLASELSPEPAAPE